jgi:hypothetical protein
VPAAIVLRGWASPVPAPLFTAIPTPRIFCPPSLPVFRRPGSEFRWIGYNSRAQHATQEEPMSDQPYRIERDSLGDIKVPADALYQAQTQRAIDNFPISGLPIPRGLIRAIALVKHASATANEKLGLLDPARAAAIRDAADEVADGRHDRHFPIDIFQTGSAPRPT